jgi:hypothetical protein
MPTPAIQTLRTDAQQVLNLDSISAVRSVVAATLANANAGTPLNPNLTTQQLWNEFYQIITQPKSDIESIIANQLMKFLYAPPAPGGVGANGQVIFNDGGVLAGDPQFLWNKTTNLLTVTGSATITGDLTAARLIVTGGTIPTNGLWLPTTNTLEFAANSLAQYRIAPLGVFSWYDGAGGTRMTLNSTGLAIGDTAFSGTRLTLRESATNPNALAMTNRNATQTWRLSVDVSAVDDKILGFYDSTSTTFRMQLTDTGNLGLGVTPSAWNGNTAIQLKSSASSITGAIFQGANGGANANGFAYNCYFDGTNWQYIFGTSHPATRYQQSQGIHSWFNASSGTGTIATFTQAMTLDASGNLSLASGYVRAAARTQIGAGYIGDINIAGNNRGLFFGSTGLLPANGTGTASDNSYNLGSGTERWATVYAGTGTINTSDRNEKQDIDDLSASEKRVASSIKQLVKKYRFKDAVASKGENARIHVGWIAQDVQSAFAAEGLDASDYGMFCSDSWYEVNGSSVDSDGKPYTSESENAVAKTRLGLRHDELLAFVVSSL